MSSEVPYLKKEYIQGPRVLDVLPRSPSGQGLNAFIGKILQPHDAQPVGAGSELSEKALGGTGGVHTRRASAARQQWDGA